MGKTLALLVALAEVGFAGCTVSDGTGEKTFTMSIEVQPGSPTPVAPLAWAVYTGSNPFFTLNTDSRINGLEPLAEDGNPAVAGGALSSLAAVSSSGVVDTPDGKSSPGPALPGDTFTVTFTAAPGDTFSFASMYGQSNDLFFSPVPDGISLFSGDVPVSGDITDRIRLYDAGTEVNEEPGVGPNQAPRQAAPNTGPDENGTVRLISDVSDGFSYPAVDGVIKVTVSSE
jgi:hypothetical protein